MLKLTKNPNLTEQAYQSVKRQLLNGSFPEGSKLTEEYLSSALGISKSPVREALMRLESEGLIIIESRRGAYVRKFSAKEVHDLYDVRALLEVHAVSSARITPELAGADGGKHRADTERISTQATSCGISRKTFTSMV